MSWTQAWIKHLHPWVLTIVCWSSITLVAFDVFAPERWKVGVVAHAPWITLILLSLFVLAYLEKERARQQLLQAAQLGIKEIYRSRVDQDQIREYEDLLGHAKQSLFIVGVTLKDLSREPGNHLLKRAADGCQIDLLMLSPQFRDNHNPVLDPVAASTGKDVLRNNFYTAIASIRQLALTIRQQNQELTGAKKGKLTVRFYTTAPTVSLTVRDGETAHARMHVEVIPHQIFQSPFRPIMNIEKAKDDGFFAEFYRRYRALWADSAAMTYIEVGHSGNMKVNCDIDAQLSDWLGLPLEWHGRAQR
jgi:hypothetical protein